MLRQNYERDHIGMNGLSQFVAYLFASGDAFFVGAVVTALGRAATWRLRQRRRAKCLRLVTLLGLIVFALSMVPLPWWMYVVAIIPSLLRLNEPFRTEATQRRSRLVWRTLPLVELLLLVAMAIELIERHQLQAQPLAHLPAEFHVIGDSLSAGIANEQDRLWPTLVAREWNVSVRNHAQAGATTASALRQAEAVNCADCLVIVEIGGNDFFEGRPAQQIEADWDRLLSQLSDPRRTLIMFELPLPPMPGEIGRAHV